MKLPLIKEEDVKKAKSKRQILDEMLDMVEKDFWRKAKDLKDHEGMAIHFKIQRFDESKNLPISDRNSQKYHEWRNKILKRDNYICQECGNKENLQVHHIKSYYKNPDERYNEENGITLCLDCHSKKHPHLKFINKSKTIKNGSTEG